MPSIAFIDTEIDPNTNRILDIGAIRNDYSTYHSSSLSSFLTFINDAEFLCGHNVLRHDLPAIRKYSPYSISTPVIDTLYLSPLLFPSRPYHNLVKDDKINPDGPNNPYNDAVKARDLFYEEVNAFRRLSPELRSVLYLLLGRTEEFASFFRFIEYNEGKLGDMRSLLREIASDEICQNVRLGEISLGLPH